MQEETGQDTGGCCGCEVWKTAGLACVAMELERDVGDHIMWEEVLPFEGDLAPFCIARTPLHTGACLGDKCPVGGREGWPNEGMVPCGWGKVGVEAE